MNLHLDKPLFFFDLETTGVNITTDRIVEFSYLKLDVDGTETRASQRINPEMHIPEASTAVHHITDEMVRDCPRFSDIAVRIADCMTGCDVGGYNSNRFDIPLLAEEFIRCGVDFDWSACRQVDVFNIFTKMEQRSLTAAYRFYCHKELDNAHSAQADTDATYEVLKAQLDRYPELQNNVGFLSEFSTQHRFVDLAGYIQFNEMNQELFTFGKYKGQRVTTILERDPGYFSWVMNADFPAYTKVVLKKIKERMATPPPKHPEFLF